MGGLVGDPNSSLQQRTVFQILNILEKNNLNRTMPFPEIGKRETPGHKKLADSFDFSLQLDSLLLKKLILA